MDKILIADKYILNSELMAHSLENKGYEILTAENGKQVLAKSLLFSPHLIIMGTEFNDMSGYDVCKKLRKSPENEFVLILFLCDLETKDSRIKAIESGADDIIDKTFDPIILSAKVASLLRVKHLSDQLKDKYNELAEKNKIYDFQLKMSQKIQMSIMKNFDFSFNHINFLSKYLPALDIGGDFYDIIKLNEDCIGVFIGDVSGHGISAALLTAMLAMMVKTLSTRYIEPDKFLYNMNNQFYQVFESSEHEIYTCIFYAVIDTKNKKIQYSNAGHVLPIFFDTANNNVFELDASGLPLGLIKDANYETKSLNFEENDMLFFYTDGLIDTFYKDNPEEFFNKTKDLLLQSKSVESLRDIIDSIVSLFYNLNIGELQKYALDDVSMILCKM